MDHPGRTSDRSDESLWRGLLIEHVFDYTPGMAVGVSERTQRVAATIDAYEIAGPDIFDEASLQAFVHDLHAIRRITDTWLTVAAELAPLVTDAPAADIIRSNGDTSRRQAERTARRSAALGDYGPLADATRRGDLPASSFDQITRAGQSLSDDDRSEFEQRLIDADAPARADEMPPESFARWANGIADDIDADRRARVLAEQEARSNARTWTDRTTGMTCLRAEFDEVRGTTIETMLDAECRSLVAKSDGTRQWGPNLRADALFELLRRGATGESGPARYAGIVVVDADTAASGELAPGGVCRLGDIDLPPATAGRLLCDATLRRVVLGADGEVLDVGRKVRDATAAQRAALEALYGGCCWPGCDAPFRATHIHHLHEWEHGGPTDLGNLRPVCVRQHHAIHEGGWTMAVLPGNRVAFVRPDGSTWQTVDAPGVDASRQRRQQRRRPPTDRPPPDRPPPGAAFGATRRASGTACADQGEKSSATSTHR